MRGTWIVALCLGLSVACFRPALPREVDVEDTTDTDDVEPNEVSPDTADITPGEVDTIESDTIEIEIDTTDTDTPSEEVDISPECSVDSECTAFASPPCVVGRCVNQRCTTVNVSVPCDDGDVCTTADQCQQGACKGRPFTAEEAKNWLIQISGSGEDAAVAVASHPSGDSLVVGAFTGTVSLPGGLQLTADGDEADAFLLRIAPRGQVLRSVRLGTPHRDIAVSVSPAEGVAQTVVALNTLNTETQEVSSAIVWVNDNGTIRHELALPGRVVRADARADGRTAVVLDFSGYALLPIAGGGQMSFTSSDVRNVLILSVDPQGVVWAKHVQSQETVNAISIAQFESGIRAALDSRASPTSLAGYSLGSSGGGHLVDLTNDGEYITHQSEVTGALMPSSYLRLHEATTHLSFGDDALGELFPRAQVVYRRDSGRSCTRVLPYDTAGPSAAWGFGRAWDKGFAVHGLAAGEVDFGGVSLQLLVRAEGFIASYDDACGLRAVWTTRLPLLDNGPPSLRFAGSDLEFYLGDSAATRAGGLTMASTVKEPKSLGSDFDDLVVTPMGGSDGIIGGYSAAKMFGCTSQQ